ncbi:hypothetical protein D3C78_1798380 [compost metagenome]
MRAVSSELSEVVSLLGVVQNITSTLAMELYSTNKESPIDSIQALLERIDQSIGVAMSALSVGSGSTKRIKSAFVRNATSSHHG